MAVLKLKNINKVYPNGVQAVFDFNLDIADRDFIVLVGPSGCGKTTTLRMLAGLEDISSGEFYIDGQLMNEVNSKDRGIAMVFQSYALYPHMTVFDNMAFGLQLRRVSRDDIQRRVAEAAQILGLEPYLDRKPRALSGGQRQRVALGRAIVRDARVFLMDEPLSNLDAKLRVQTRGELIKLHNRLNSTTVYVTHDQIEAMTMATKIVVMKNGWIQQVGNPKDIYNYPDNVFVGGFMGTPPMNFMKGTVSAEGYFTTADGQYHLLMPKEKLSLIKNKGYMDKQIILGIRPEDILDDLNFIENNPELVINVKVNVSELLGSETNIYTNIAGSEIVAAVSAREDLKFGSNITLALNLAKSHFFDEETEKAIR